MKAAVQELFSIWKPCDACLLSKWEHADDSVLRFSLFAMSIGYDTKYDSGSLTVRAGFYNCGVVSFYSSSQKKSLKFNCLSPPPLFISSRKIIAKKTYSDLQTLRKRRKIFTQTNYKSESQRWATARHKFTRTWNVHSLLLST